MNFNEYRVGHQELKFEGKLNEKEIEKARYIVEPWLSALFQSEHLSMLIGSGFTAGAASMAKAFVAGMEIKEKDLELNELVTKEADRTAKLAGRGDPNLEDQIRAIVTLINGLKMLEDDRYIIWEKHLNNIILDFLKSILKTERGILEAINKGDQHGNYIVSILSSFLLSFTSRSASRERLNIFTTNYDRLIEHVSDLLGIRIIDRFVGSLNPIYRASRLGIDMHYNPPGIRGEPRYLEGVVRLTKLHGSIDWKFESPYLRRYGIPFGASINHTDIPTTPADTVMIYPNSAKDVETLEYPYADLFRDFSAAICQHNSVLVTYGYGFGDDHINRAIKDMLTIPSTHLVVISYDDTGGRVSSFIDSIGKSSQTTLLIGDHFGDIESLVKNYLPKPAIDYISLRQAQLIENRTPEFKEGLVAMLKKEGGDRDE